MDGAVVSVHILGLVMNVMDKTVISRNTLGIVYCFKM